MKIGRMRYSRAPKIMARIGDAVIVILMAAAAYLLRFGFSNFPVPPGYSALVLFAALLTVLLFPLFGVYDSWRGRGTLVLVGRVLAAWSSVLFVLFALVFLAKVGPYFSRIWLVEWATLTFIGMFLFRVVMSSVLRKLYNAGWNRSPIVIVGAGDLGRQLLKQTHEQSWSGFDVVAFFDDAAEIPELDGIPVIKPQPGDLERFVSENSIHECWIALPLSAEQRIHELMYELRHSTVNIRYVPDIYNFRLLNYAVSEVVGVPMMDLSATPMAGVNRYVKAIEDRLLAFLILLLVSPLMLLIALAVRLSSPGPVIFRQKRHGWDGREITVYKFRTMYVHDEPAGTVSQASRNDGRVTKVGVFLRRTSLDELPQFFNVLNGSMSIVGPRPHAVEHNEQYKDLVESYALRHKVKPGITGWAQVNGCRGETDTVEKMRKRVELDLYYIENWSLWFDIRIILMTLWSGFTDKNAY